ncbi:MAG: PH domain-containing protein [Planctomycetales bacterium]|nr:PH domain-containing protein [Planctomycetales bacterium]
MSGEVPPNVKPENPSSESQPRDRFTAAAADKMDATRDSAVERKLWQGGYSPKAMYGTWMLCGVSSIALLVAVGLLAAEQQTVWLVVGAVILVGWAFALGLYLYRRFSMHYELTTQRFVHQTGLLSRRTDRIEVIDIDDVSYTQGIVQRMLGVGTITLTGSDRTHPELTLQGIDKVPEIAGLIDDVRREERRRRSLHIEAI